MAPHRALATPQLTAPMVMKLTDCTGRLGKVAQCIVMTCRRHVLWQPAWCVVIPFTGCLTALRIHLVGHLGIFLSSRSCISVTFPIVATGSLTGACHELLQLCLTVVCGIGSTLVFSPVSSIGSHPVRYARFNLVLRAFALLCIRMSMHCLGVGAAAQLYLV
jgi:hypothetical protein